MKFKIGDRVRCINNKSYEQTLTINKCYIVIISEHGFVDFINDSNNHGSAFIHRFELYRKENQTEVDFLDNIQRNMQE